MLSKICEDAGAYVNAEQTQLRAKATKPNDPDTHRGLAAFYNRRGQVDRTNEALEERAAKHPTNPEGSYKARVD
jgi:Flp pilus assembly protein TadD